MLFGKRKSDSDQLNQKPRQIVEVGLDGMLGVGLIVPYPSGVIYTNQAGGYGCSQPKMEGFFVPTPTGGGRMSNGRNDCPLSLELLAYFVGPKWNGHCDFGIDIETADYLDTLFEKYFSTKHFRVNRDALGSSMEAWINVTLNNTNENYKGFSGIASNNGVLTWPNSD